MSYPHAYIEYLVQFHAARDYFECHEILEEYWKAEPESPFRTIWVGFIQIAVSMYHERRSNIQGARKMMSSAIKNLHGQPLDRLGMNSSALIAQLNQKYNQLLNGPDAAFEDLNLPIQDRSLKEACLLQCEKLKLLWGQPSDMADEYLLHKHTRRDRSEVIRTREIELERRKAN